MDAVTYPNAKVADYMNANVVAVRIGHEEEPLAGRYLVKWTPRLFVLDPEEITHHQIMGFLPPDELVPFLHLGRAKAAFHADRLDEAAEMLDQLLQETPASASAPEAVFLRGVSRFKKDHDKSHLQKVYRTLRQDYPGSEWAPRGFPYWNL